MLEFAILNTSSTYFLFALLPIASFGFTIINLCHVRFHCHSLDSWMESTGLPSSPLPPTSVSSSWASSPLPSSTTRSIRDLLSRGSMSAPERFGRREESILDSGRWVACALGAFFTLGTMRGAGERYRAFGRTTLAPFGEKCGRQEEASGDIKSWVLSSYLLRFAALLTLGIVWAVGCCQGSLHAQRNHASDHQESSHPFLPSHVRLL